MTCHDGSILIDFEILAVHGVLLYTPGAFFFNMQTGPLGSSDEADFALVPLLTLLSLLSRPEAWQYQRRHRIFAFSWMFERE
jgi:hypothetical protein